MNLTKYKSTENAFRDRKNWGWLLFNGLLSFELGALIWAELPSSAAWAIGLLAGVYLIFDGWAPGCSFVGHTRTGEPDDDL